MLYEVVIEVELVVGSIVEEFTLMFSERTWVIFGFFTGLVIVG
jgi:hypothetical protein